jgi:hypothetical protein
MADMTDPIIEDLEELIDDYSVPEIIDGLITIARHYKEAMKAEGDTEWQGWDGIEIELSRALKGMGGV